MLLWNAAPSICGNARIEDAKITGITPPAFTRSGRCVDCPPITFRPTTRLAYWTGIRRSLRSTNTMNATTAIISTSNIRMAGAVNTPQALVCTFWYRSITPRGKPTTMPAKISNDMPLPMPRSVICSPSHMMKALPVVSVSMVIRMNPGPGLVTKSPAFCRLMAMPNDCTALKTTVR